MRLKGLHIVLVAVLLGAGALSASAQFKQDAFTQTYADTTLMEGKDTTDKLFSFPEFFGGLAHKREARIGTLFAGSTVFIGSYQIYHKQYWKLPIVYGGIGAGVGLGTYYTVKYKKSVKAHDQSLEAYNEAYALDPNTPLTVSPVDSRSKTLGICMFGMAAAVYWATLMDGAANYKRGVYPQAGKATIYSILLPGLGQAYNGEYWKIPIYWGCMAGATHFLVTNDINYKRYKRIHNEATTPGSSYSGPISAETALYYRDVFRRYRDYSIVALVGFYLLQVIDANVFSYMLDFDMSNDISMQLEPAIIEPLDRYAIASTGGRLSQTSFGIRMGFRF